MSDTLQLSLPVEDQLQAQLAAPDNDSLFSGCTGERREKIRKLRSTILELTAAGVGVRRIASALAVSPQVVRAVRHSAWHTGELDQEKQRLGRDYLAAADLLRAEALERIDSIPAQVLLLASAQAADKGQLLTGGVTARVERAAPAADLDALIQALPRAVVEVSSRPVETEQAPALIKGPAGGDQGSSSSLVEPRVDSESTASPSEGHRSVSARVSPPAS